jgi:pyrroloquinoline quinone (PQQ) biosynthesis protein C
MVKTTAEELLTHAHHFPFAQHRFVIKLRQGDYPRQTLQIYGRGIYQLSESLPRQLAILISQCPDANLRFHLIENLLEEEGILCQDQGLKVDLQRRHSELAKCFTRALQVKDSELSKLSAVSSFRFERLLANGQWLAAIAYITVGIEANVSQIFSLIVPALQHHYQFTDSELVFFIEHIVADQKHGLTGATLLAQLIRTSEQYEEVLWGIKSGVTALQAFHQAVDREICQAISAATNVASV